MKISSLQKGLVGHWTMAQDSLKGSLLADKTPYENDGTIYGATFTTDRKGKANSAMSFDGTNDYIDCGNDDSLNITDEITISAWAKYETISGWDIIFERIKSTHIYNLFMYDYDGYVRIASNFGLTKTGNTQLYPNKWYHLTVTVDSNNFQKLYVNGVLDGTYSSITISDTSGVNAYIGARLGLEAYFNGSIDDVRIYNRALSAEEIKLLYESYNPILKI